MNSSIISGNTAYSESSGGIYNVGTMTLYNSTIGENMWREWRQASATTAI